MQAETQTAHVGQATGVDFGSVNVGSTSAVAPLSFTFDTAGTLVSRQLGLKIQLSPLLSFDVVTQSGTSLEGVRISTSD
jgi:hypothetical protein